MTSKPTVGMIGAFDTKGEDFTFMYQKLQANGCKVVAIDIGIFSAKVSFPVAVSTEELLAPEVRLAELRTKKERPAAVNAVKHALKEKIEGICKRHGIVALIGAGGTNGTDIITTAMQEMPRTMPKVCLSTVAQHENWQYTKTANIILIDSCVDVGGLNDISREKYTASALIISTLAKSSLEELAPKLPAIGISMFGNTTKCVERCSELFREKNFQVMPFHAVGTGGKNLEALVRDGTIRSGVLDLTLQEIPASLVGGIYSAGDTRLSAPGETKTPHLVIPGCVDMVILGPIEEAKKRYPRRHLYKCNSSITAMRTTSNEMRKTARYIAEKVNAAAKSGSPVAVLIPAKGFSMFDETLAGWHNPAANKALINELVKKTAPEVPLKIVDAYINDRSFADLASSSLLKMIAGIKLNWPRNPA